MDIIRLELELTSTCNLQCPLCIRTIDQNSINTKIKYRPLSEIINQLEEAQFNNLKYITIAGPISEPTLYPDLFELLKYLNKRKLEISLFINGDTHDDLYYKKLGIIFRSGVGHIYFTICGSTQELHSKYRVGSSLEKVLNNLDIVKKYSDKAILTWIIFNYNEADYHTNYKRFKKVYELEVFNTLPMNEHFGLDGDIHLIENLHNFYKKEIDRNIPPDMEQCPATRFQFKLLDHQGNLYPCGLYKLYGDKHCFECQPANIEKLRLYNIYNIAEPESDISEIGLRYDINKK